MESNTKILLAILIVITLPITIPITIPLAIISAGIIFTVLLFILGMLFMDIKITISATVIVLLGYGIYKWLSRNG